jgi:phage terminase large subunit-like protein
VIGEVNQGGDLIESTLRTIDKTVSYRAVHATRGKVIRAEPIAALYEQGKVHHIGVLPELEDQMCEWVPNDKTQKSPDRMDALVWAITDLMEHAGGRKYTIIGGERF